MAATAIPGTSRESFVLDGVSWQLYQGAAVLAFRDWIRAGGA